jgi:hypothetical protein
MQRSSHDDLGRGVCVSSHASATMQLPGYPLQKAQFLGFNYSPTTLWLSHVSQFCCLGGRPVFKRPMRDLEILGI